MEPDPKSLLMTITGGVAHLVINQPPSNCLTLEFFSALSQAIQSIQDNPECRAVVISGKGRHFSSGSDLDNLLQSIHDEVPEFMISHYRSFLALRELKIPVVAAIRGVCLGSALELALACHFRICGVDAVFGLPEASFNLIPGLGGSSMITELAGKAAALELILTGKTFLADEALHLKIVDQVVPKKELIQRSFDFTRNIMSNYRKEKRCIYLKTCQN